MLAVCTTVFYLCAAGRSNICRDAFSYNFRFPTFVDGNQSEKDRNESKRHENNMCSALHGRVLPVPLSSSCWKAYLLIRQTHF